MSTNELELKYLIRKKEEIAYYLYSKPFISHKMWLKAKKAYRSIDRKMNQMNYCTATPANHCFKSSTFLVRTDDRFTN